jgi:hypothetical protein
LDSWTTIGYCRKIWLHVIIIIIIIINIIICGRLYNLVVKFPGNRSRGPGFDCRRYQIFWVVVGPFSLVRTISELLEWNEAVTV